MKASKMKPVPSHRLLKPDDIPRRKVVPPRINPVWLRFHPGVRFPGYTDAPRTSMEAALRQAGL